MVMFLAAANERLTLAARRPRKVAEMAGEEEEESIMNCLEGEAYLKGRRSVECDEKRRVKGVNRYHNTNNYRAAIMQ